MAMFGPYPGVILAWHDGDSCHIDLDLGFALHLQGQPACRIFGINAPELGTDAGKQALAAAVGFCPVGTKVTVASHGWDKYGGRFDGSLTLPDGSDFAAKMLASGNAVVYP